MSRATGWGGRPGRKGVAVSSGERRRWRHGETRRTKGGGESHAGRKNERFGGTRRSPTHALKKKKQKTSKCKEEVLRERAV